MSRPIVVADAGPLIALARCHQLELLDVVFEGIHVPHSVLDEATADRLRPGASEILAFVQASAQVHPNQDDAIYAAAIEHLDEGEAQALSLAHRLQCGVLMDERRGRQAAQRLGLPLFGVLGVLLQAQRLKRISHIAPIVQKLRDNGYRIAQSLVDTALKVAGENLPTE